MEAMAKEINNDSLESSKNYKEITFPLRRKKLKENIILSACFLVSTFARAFVDWSTVFEHSFMKYLLDFIITEITVCITIKNQKDHLRTKKRKQKS